MSKEVNCDSRKRASERNINREASFDFDLRKLTKLNINTLIQYIYETKTTTKRIAILSEHILRKHKGKWQKVEIGRKMLQRYAIKDSVKSEQDGDAK